MSTIKVLESGARISIPDVCPSCGWNIAEEYPGNDDPECPECREWCGKIVINCDGYHSKRLNNDCDYRERIYAELWRKENHRPRFVDGGIPLVWALRGEARHQVTTEDEERIAATVIQWLGSNCGQDFIEEAQKKIKGAPACCTFSSMPQEPRP